MNTILSAILLSMMVKASLLNQVSESVDCSEDYAPHCTCSEVPNGRILSCNVFTRQEFFGIRRKLSNNPKTNYTKVVLSIKKKLDIPENILGERNTLELELSCSDRSTPLGPIHPDAFRSSMNYTEKLVIQDCDLTQTSFGFLSSFSLQSLFVVSCSIQEMVDMPYLPQLSSIAFIKTTNFSSWYAPTQTPNLRLIFITNSPDLDDKKMDSILAIMSENLIYPKLTHLDISSNSLTRIPHLVSIFPALTHLDLSGNPIHNLTTGSAHQLGSTQLRLLDLSRTQLTTIKPGAFEGNFSSTTIRLNDNLMTSFQSSSFKDLLNSMVNHHGSIHIERNPIVWDCNLAWLLVDDRNLLRHFHGQIANGTEFKNLNPKELSGC